MRVNPAQRLPAGWRWDPATVPGTSWIVPAADRACGCLLVGEDPAEPKMGLVDFRRSFRAAWLQEVTRTRIC